MINYRRYFNCIPILIEFIKTVKTPEAYRCLAAWDKARGKS